jgi:hypothetical protein
MVDDSRVIPHESTGIAGIPTVTLNPWEMQGNSPEEARSRKPFPDELPPGHRRRPGEIA